MSESATAATSSIAQELSAATPVPIRNVEDAEDLGAL